MSIKVDEDILSAAVLKIKLNLVLKSEQKLAIQEVCLRNDVLVVLPTGFGKSIIYSMIPICFDVATQQEGHIILVISPLIALMEDQVASLELYGLNAACISENQKNAEIRQGVLNGRFNVVFMSPESLFTGNWRDMILQDVYQQNLCCIAVDEAHCVEEWGKEYRTDYNRIHELRALVPDIPILALTATAAPPKRLVIKKILSMKNSKEVIASANRSNITYNCTKSSHDIRIRLQWLVTLLRKEKRQCPKCIIYCRNVDTVGTIYNMVMDELGDDSYEGKPAFQNSLVAMFHRKTVQRNKEHVLQTFPQTDSLVRIIIATSAFGMGINIPDVRIVVHWGAPRTIESFYQESGRAGRDGLCSTSLVYYHPTNVSMKKTDKEMSQYCKDSSLCRRKRLQNYFTPSFEIEASELLHVCCDICRNKCECGSCPPNIDQNPPADDISSVSDNPDTSETEIDELEGM